MDKEFRQILVEFLKENELTQSEFSRRIGAKPWVVCDWLRGKANPSYDMLKRMAQAFSVPADYFLGLTDDY